ncbi:MAG: MinD/ParA family protein [Candidatus Micrarchaeota archaeon]|nr:MinD/ParA family protein [Candidatus Micrarchaeota archaeon]
MPKKIISVVSGKGGVGKSTLAVNIATLLSRAGASTVLIDADIYNPCVFFHLGLSPQSSGLQELLDGSATIEETLPIHPASGLRCISSSLHTYGKIKIGRMHKLIDMLNYEYIIIDCPPGFSPLIEEAVSSSNNVFVMMTPDMPSCTAALKLVTFIRNHLKGREMRFTYFLNRVSNSPYEIHPREVESLFHTRLASIIDEDLDVPKSIAAKTPLVLMSPQGRFSKTLRSFSSMLLRSRDHSFDMSPQPQETVQPQQVQTMEKTGFFAWLSGIFRRFTGR